MGIFGKKKSLEASQESALTKTQATARNVLLKRAEEAIQGAYRQKRLVFITEGATYTDKQGRKESYSDDSLAQLFYDKMVAEMGRVSIGGMSGGTAAQLVSTVEDIKDIIAKTRREAK